MQEVLECLAVCPDRHLDASAGHQKSGGKREHSHYSKLEVAAWNLTSCLLMKSVKTEL